MHKLRNWKTLSERTDILNKNDIREGELELINKHTRTPLTENDVYAFSVILCDNDIDRDFERFSDNALDELAKLFDGVTGIADHNPKSSNQTARIFSCKAEFVPDKFTSDGKPYKRLFARAYVPKSEKGFITSLESGIKKEVSVGCSVKKRICSICGNEIALCSHSKGKYYSDKLCFVTLDKPTDAYEWSFVAVPAQKNAGVIKNFNPKGNHTMNIEKRLFSGEEQTFSADEVRELAETFRSLKQKANDGEIYRNSLIKEIKTLSAFALPDISAETLENITNALSVSQLNELIKAFEAKTADIIPVEPQLSKNGSVRTSNNIYKNI